MQTSPTSYLQQKKGGADHEAKLKGWGYAGLKINMKSLQEICLTHIQWTLEEYPVDVLALLPKVIREEMLHNLPIVDICRLEDTQFTSGIDMDSVWKELYKRHIDAEATKSEGSWRQRYLHKLSLTTLNEGRLYGYFSCVLGRGNLRTTISDEQHPADIVNYLVAVKVGENESDLTSSIVGHLYLRYHEVIQEKGLVPPGPLYDRACQSKQLTPPRYKQLFPKDSCYLPDSVALELLGKQCHFCPKEIVIYTQILSNFYNSADQATPDLSFLADFLKDVESLAIRGKKKHWFGRSRHETRMALGLDVPLPLRQHRRRKPVRTTTALPAPVTVWQAAEVASEVLQLIVSTANPKLTSLGIERCSEADNFIPSLSPILTSSYCRLKELHVSEVTPDISKLIAITEHQPLLHTISITIRTDSQHIYQSSEGSFAEKYTPQISQEELKSWIQVCLQKRLLKHLKLDLTCVTGDTLVQIVAAFLSTSCSHSQTLTLTSITIGQSWVQKTLTEAVSPTYHVLPCKSLVLESCHFESFFCAALFGLQPLKLKELVIRDSTVDFSPLFQQPAFDVQSLVIVRSGYRQGGEFGPNYSNPLLIFASADECAALLTKKTLVNVSLKDCQPADHATIHKTSTQLSTSCRISCVCHDSHLCHLCRTSQPCSQRRDLRLSASLNFEY